MHEGNVGMGKFTSDCSRWRNEETIFCGSIKKILMWCVLWGICSKEGRNYICLTNECQNSYSKSNCYETVIILGEKILEHLESDFL